MSLTSFLRDREVAERFRREFEKPRLDSTAPLAAPPLTRSYTMTGTAFDYLLRFYLKKVYPWAVEQEWAAEKALGMLKAFNDPRFVIEEVDINKALRKAKRILSAARAAYRRYLRGASTSKPGKALIEAAAGLAQLDPFYRAGVIDASGLGRISRKVTRDLANLLRLVDLRNFGARESCLLNPCFGRASDLVGGADADLVVDGTLIDIKTTKFVRLDRATFNQLVGYYLLHRIGGIDGCRKDYRIERLGVYYSRYGVLFSFPAETVVRERRLRPISRWFVKRARELQADDATLAKG